MTEDYLNIIVCSPCAKITPVDSVEGWMKRQLIESPTDNGTSLTCPLCGQIVYWVGISGELEFGI